MASIWRASDVLQDYGSFYPSMHFSWHFGQVGYELTRSLGPRKKGWMFRDIGLPEWLFEIDQTPASAISDELLLGQRKG